MTDATTRKDGRNCKYLLDDGLCAAEIEYRHANKITHPTRPVCVVVVASEVMRVTPPDPQRLATVYRDCEARNGRRLDTDDQRASGPYEINNVVSGGVSEPVRAGVFTFKGDPLNDDHYDDNDAQIADLKAEVARLTSLFKVARDECDNINREHERKINAIRPVLERELERREQSGLVDYIKEVADVLDIINKGEEI